MSKVNDKSSLILSENLFPVVGVGASAGGMEAFKELLQAIPEDSGMAYILIQHLAPQHESILTEILQKSTRLPVVEIVDNIKVLPDHIYIIPSNRSLIANDGRLQLEPLVKGEKLNTIDVFFTSLSEIHQEHAIGVVFSGTGSDGTVGLKTIKDMGGITIAQDEQSAAYADMPQSAIQSEVVDFILKPAEVPGHLIKLLGSTENSTSHLNMEEEIKEDHIFQKILSLLHLKKGVDFNFYKQTTIRRRIIRRKSINRIEHLKEYLQFLTENKNEQEALFNDILIPVTAFFRDHKIFTELCEKVFPGLIIEKTAAEPIRVWIAGCSTGEEAYSVAICLYEFLQEKGLPNKVQIFATDISEVVIAKARSGIYLKKDMAGLSEARVKQFFTKMDGSYQVNKVIREMCVFACQNFLKDPPFAKIDLISCRNVHGALSAKKSPFRISLCLKAHRFFTPGQIRIYRAWFSAIHSHESAG
jgi:two-component system CheB/CheR fusion protein